MNNYDWASLILTPFCSAIAWLFGWRKRKNDSIAEMQGTIDVLVEKNAELYKEVIALREENAELRQSIAVMQAELSQLRAMLPNDNGE